MLAALQCHVVLFLDVLVDDDDNDALRVDSFGTVVYRSTIQSTFRRALKLCQNWNVKTCELLERFVWRDIRMVRRLKKCVIGTIISASLPLWLCVGRCIVRL